MTAPLFNLPLTTPVAGAPAANGGQGALGGFEALLAAFFGTQGETAAEGGLFATDGDKAAGDKPAEAAPVTPGTTAPDAAILAAMLAVPQQIQQPAATPPIGDAPDAAGGQAKAVQPFAPVPPQAPGLAQTQAQVQSTADAAVDAAADAVDGDLPQTAVQQQTEALPNVQAPPVRDRKPAADTAPVKPQPAATPAAPTVPQLQAQAQVQAKPEPVAAAPAQPEAAVAQAAELEAPVEPAPVAQKPSRPAEARRAASTTGAPPAGQAQAQGAASANPVAAAANATSAAEPASAAEADVLAPAPRDAKAEPAAADAPDAALPPPAAPAAPAHAAASPAHAAPARVTSETVANLTAQIGKKLEGRSTRFEVELAPAGLGHVSVSVEIAASGKLTAAMSFDNPQAAAELRSRSHELQRALEQAGFDLSGGISFDVAGDQGRQAQQQQQQNDGAAWRGRAFQAVLGTAGEAAETAAAAALQYNRRSQTGVDIRI